MKYFPAVCAVCFVVMAALACQKEITGLGGDSANTTTPSKKCTGCSYLPVCDSAKLTYIDSSAAGVDTVTSTMAILGDTTVNGKKFTKVSAFAAFSQGLLYNCDGGNYSVYQAVPNLGLNVDSLLQSVGLPGGATLPSHIQTTILKTGVAAGAAWSDTVLQVAVFGPLKAVVTLAYTLQEKGVQRTVLGKTYSNVLHVNSTANIAVPLSPAMPLGVDVDTYYADGVGIIESRTTNNGAVQSATKRYK